MKRTFVVATSLLILFGILVAGCSSTSETEKTESASVAPLAKELLYKEGHRLYLTQNSDSARILLEKALAIDPKYKEALADLAPLHYERAMRATVGKDRTDGLRRARDYYVQLEQLGSTDSETYERICEISSLMNDNRTFVKFAKKNIEQYPFERQYYNLSVALMETGDYNGVIKYMKDAVAKFKQSQFIGSFYRQMGRAYMKVDRDQTAEKTFYAGLDAVDGRIDALRKTGGDYKSTPEYSRLKDDKIGMLTSLKALHTTYQALQKLAGVEKQLKELGK